MTVTTLPDDIRALLQVVHDALDVPHANTTEDHRVRAELLDARASDARIMLTAAIRGDQIPDLTDQLLRWTANRPVTYTVWVPAAAQAAEGDRSTPPIDGPFANEDQVDAALFDSWAEKDGGRP